MRAVAANWKTKIDYYAAEQNRQTYHSSYIKYIGDFFRYNGNLYQDFEYLNSSSKVFNDYSAVLVKGDFTESYSHELCTWEINQVISATAPAYRYNYNYNARLSETDEVLFFTDYKIDSICAEVISNLNNGRIELIHYDVA
jgi:hypothetical protein